MALNVHLRLMQLSYPKALQLAVVGLLISLAFGVRARTEDIALQVLWDKRFGSSGPRLAEDARSIATRDSGGFLVSGTRDTADMALAVDVFFLWLDEQGELELSRSLDNCRVDEPFSVIQDIDGGFVVAGGTKGESRCGLDCVPVNGDYYPDVFLFKIDSAGEKRWSHVYGGDRVDIGRSVVACNDGGWGIVGFTDSIGAGGRDVYLLKTDREGQLVWRETYGGSGDEAAYSLVTVESGGFIIAGKTRPIGHGFFEPYVIRTDVSGRKLWSTSIANSRGHALSVALGNDDSVVVTGQSTGENGRANLYLFKLNLNGNLLWRRVFESGDSERPRATGVAVRRVDNGFVVLGRASLRSTRTFLLRVNDQGDLLWRGFLPGARAGADIVCTAGGGYVVTGRTEDAEGIDVFVTKVIAEEVFVRGDTNGDGRRNITDAAFLLLHLFRGGTQPPCEKSADNDDNGALAISDAVFLLNFLFRDGGAPGEPFAHCGTDLTVDELSCASFPACE